MESIDDVDALLEAPFQQPGHASHSKPALKESESDKIKYRDDERRSYEDKRTYRGDERDRFDERRYERRYDRDYDERRYEKRYDRNEDERRYDDRRNDRNYGNRYDEKRYDHRFDHRNENRYEKRYYNEPRGEDRRYAEKERRSRTRSPGPVALPVDPPLPLLTRSPTPPASDRDRRTVFVTQISQRASEFQVRQFFEEHVGDVNQVKLVGPPKRHRGVGYVEFRKESSIKPALALTGRLLMGIPIVVQLTEAEKNRIAEEAAAAARANKTDSHSMTRLYVSLLLPSLTEDDLRQVFEPYGPMDFVHLAVDDQGKSKGFAHVQYKHPADAKMAAEVMNGFVLAGRAIRVQMADVSSNAPTVATNVSNVAMNQSSSSHTAKTTNNNNYDMHRSRQDERRSGPQFVLDEREGVTMTAQRRFDLMRKLARDSPTAPSSDTTFSSTCILLRNIYNPLEETDPHWASDIAEEVRGECQKIGRVLHLRVALNLEGDVYVQFDQPSAASRACQTFHGRWFASRQVVCQLVHEAQYLAMHPEAQRILTR